MHADGLEQPNFVIVTKRLDRQAADLGKVSNTYHSEGLWLLLYSLQQEKSQS
jgi:hypothetical protein